MTRQEMKNAAKGQLKNNWLWAIGVTLVAGIINSLISGSVSWPLYAQGISQGLDPSELNKHILLATPSQFLIGIVTSLIAWGVMFTFLQFRDDQKTPNIFKGIFSAFTAERFKNTFLTSLLANIFIALWSLLLLIPGIIKSYSYAMAPYIMQDMFAASKNNMSATEAINESRKLMNGNKWDLFVFELSFLGWGILSIFTLFIGFIWLVPYYQQSKANFYRNLAGDKYLVTALN